MPNGVNGAFRRSMRPMTDQGAVATAGEGSCPYDGNARTLRCAWMISLASPGPWRILFFVWLTLNEQKWVTFDERRRWICCKWSSGVKATSVWSG
jgi:hypothetical protein